MKLITLTEYCMFIFFAGVYLAITGFTAIRIGGDQLDEDIVSFVRKKYNLLIGERTAEEVKIEISVRKTLSLKRMKSTGSLPGK